MLLLGAVPAAAYDYPVHFYSTAYVARTLNLAPQSQEWQLLALCTHLPDESVELAALNNRRGLRLRDHLGWGLFSRRASASTRRMITNHQLLHALTGGEATATTDAAVRIARRLWQEAAAAAGPPRGGIRPRTASLCALGFGLHLLGDSFAHRKLSDRARDRMYRTGLGHFADATLPDAVLRRHTDPPEYNLHYWRDYALALTEVVNGAGPVDPQVAALFDELRGISENEGRRANRVAQQRILAHFAGPALPNAWRPESHRKEPCEAYLRKLYDAPPGPPFTCQDVWRRFRVVAEDVYLQAPPGLREYADVGRPGLEFVDPEFGT